MRFTHMLAMAAFVVATAFITSEAFAQWSDGGPEMYPLTYPPETVKAKSELRMTDLPSGTVQTAEALPSRWSDGGPERFSLTYPPQTVGTQTDSRIAARECNVDRSFEVLALWSDGGPEMHPLTYPPEAAMTNGEICVAKDSETAVDGISDQLTMR